MRRRRPSGPSPTARTLAALRSAGYIAEPVERWIGPPVPSDGPADGAEGSRLDAGDATGTQGRGQGGTAIPGPPGRSPRRPFRVRRDLFGVADVEAFHPDEGGMLLIQACTAGDLANRLKRTMAHENAGKLVRSSGRRLEVWGWRIGGGVAEQKRWKVTIVALHRDSRGGCRPGMPVTALARDVKRLLGAHELRFSDGYTGHQAPRRDHAEGQA